MSKELNLIIVKVPHCRSNNLGGERVMKVGLVSLRNSFNSNQGYKNLMS